MYEHEQGYLILAVNTDETDYVACARALAHSLRHWHPDVKICLLTDREIQDPLFDIIKVLPHGDLGGWNNDWQAFESSPFHETIKLEADMLVTGPVDHWWDMFRHRDMVLTTHCLDHRGDIGRSRRYRKIFDDNHLPDVYNAVTYWRVSRTAETFARTVKTLFQNWDQAKLALRGGQTQTANTDLIYAVAAQMIGVESVTLPNTTYPYIVHMKSAILGISSADWTHELIWELIDGVFRVNGIAQSGFVHYNNKSLAQDFLKIYEHTD